MRNPKEKDTKMNADLQRALEAIERWEKDPPSRWSCPCGFTGGSRNICQHRHQCLGWQMLIAVSRWRNRRRNATAVQP